jgi:hypothetical protein
MAVDERSKAEQKQTSNNVHAFIPRAARSTATSKQGPSPVATEIVRRRPRALDSDDDPGPPAA